MAALVMRSKRGLQYVVMLALLENCSNLFEGCRQSNSSRAINALAHRKGFAEIVDRRTCEIFEDQVTAAQTGLAGRWR